MFALGFCETDFFCGLFVDARVVAWWYFYSLWLRMWVVVEVSGYALVFGMRARV